MLHAAAASLVYALMIGQWLGQLSFSSSYWSHRQSKAKATIVAAVAAAAAMAFLILHYSDLEACTLLEKAHLI